jgi:hypothetical protein
LVRDWRLKLEIMVIIDSFDQSILSFNDFEVKVTSKSFDLIGKLSSISKKVAIKFIDDEK